MDKVLADVSNSRQLLRIFTDQQRSLSPERLEDQQGASNCGGRANSDASSSASTTRVPYARESSIDLVSQWVQSSGSQTISCMKQPQRLNNRLNLSAIIDARSMPEPVFSAVRLPEIQDRIRLHLDAATAVNFDRAVGDHKAYARLLGKLLAVAPEEVAREELLADGRVVFYALRDAFRDRNNDQVHFWGSRDFAHIVESYIRPGSKLARAACATAELVEECASLRAKRNRLFAACLAEHVPILAMFAKFKHLENAYKAGAFVNSHYAWLQDPVDGVFKYTKCLPEKFYAPYIEQVWRPDGIRYITHLPETPEDILRYKKKGPELFANVGRVTALLTMLAISLTLDKHDKLQRDLTARGL